MSIASSRGAGCSRKDAVTALLVFLLASTVGWWSLQQFRAAGAKPFFYQSNFEPAVLLACGKTFGLVQPPFAPLTEFLAVRRESITCAEISGVNVTPLTTAAHANWYYMYGAAAAVWKITGVTWGAIDILVSLLAGLASLALFGIFRLVTATAMAALAATVLTLSPPNLNAMLSLRDYSKAPFVLIAVWILGVLALRPLSRRTIWLLSSVYGAIVGIGYGFRGDLIVMVPIGAVFVALFLPDVKAHIVRNGVAAVALIATFAVVAWPVLSGLKRGGCQYHFALLGLTTPLTGELRLEPAAYRFGDHLTDTFVDLKVGDYASRVLGEPAPGLCDANYDRASGELYFTLARTMPADFLVRAYASVLSILRAGLHIPDMVQPMPPFPDSSAVRMLYRAAGAVTSRLAVVGPLVMAAAIVAAWCRSPRLALALTFLVLTLGGYPMVQFEARHWFHLRFLPWWGALALAAGVTGRTGIDRRRVATGVAAVMAIVVALAGVLIVVRLVQQRAVGRVVDQYRRATLEPLPHGPIDGAVIPVRWTGVERGSSWQTRASDLLVVTIGDHCVTAGMTLKTRYTFRAPSHDLSTTVAIGPSRNGGPTLVFMPIFRGGIHEQEYLRFAGLEIAGAPASCVTSVARAADADRFPLWLQLVDGAGRTQPLYQTMRAPRIFNW